jgi:hypothetical protein
MTKARLLKPKPTGVTNMSTKNLQSVPAAMRDLFINPPLLNRENPKLYYQLLEKMIEQLQPRTVIEWLLLKDQVDYAWEALRMRRLKGPLIDIEGRRSMAEVLRKLQPADADRHPEIQRLAAQWMSDPKAYKAAMDILMQNRVTRECVTAIAMTGAAAALETVDKFESAAVARRDAAVREFQRQREELLLSKETGPVIDAAGNPDEPPAGANP